MAHQRNISIAQLRYFLKAAEHLSMTEAANELFMAQSAMSTAIDQLEKTLSTRLFLRRPAKGLSLTASGIEMRIRARSILSELDDAIDALDPTSLRGSLHAACYSTLAPFYLPQLIHELVTDHPDLEPHVRELSAEGVNLALEKGEVEIALTYDLGLAPNIQRERLGRSAVYAAVSTDHPLANRDSVTLAELVDTPMVLLDLPSSRDYFLGLFTREGLTPSVRFTFESFETVRSMVALGYGFTILNQRPAQDVSYDGFRLHTLALPDDVLGIEMVLATAPDRTHLTSKAEAFAEKARTLVAAASARPH